MDSPRSSITRWKSSSTTSLDRLLTKDQHATTALLNEGTDGRTSVSSEEADIKQTTVNIGGSSQRVNHEPPPYVRSLSPEERQQAEKALVRKIDVRLIPPIILMYILNYIDRNNIASARLAGLEADLRLHGTQYQTCELKAGWTL